MPAPNLSPGVDLTVPLKPPTGYRSRKNLNALILNFGVAVWMSRDDKVGLLLQSTSYCIQNHI